MNEALIVNWNKAVSKEDTVYHLGDFSLSHDHNPLKFLDRLNCKNFFFIFGNHDRDMERIHPQDVKGKTYQVGREHELVNVNGQDIVLCHYAMRTWDKSHRGSWQLYGHTHGTLPDDPNLLSVDVGVDCWNYTPVSFEQLKETMKKKTWKPITDYEEKRNPTGGMDLSKEEYEKKQRYSQYLALKEEFEV